MTTNYEKPILQCLRERNYSHSIGKTRYWRISGSWNPFTHSDGVLYLLESGHASWVLDFIGGRQGHEPFRTDKALLQIQYWSLTVNGDGSIEMKCEREPGDVVFTQDIYYNDHVHYVISLPRRVKFYLVEMRNYWLLSDPPREEKPFSWLSSPPQSERKTSEFGRLLLPEEY